MAADLHIHIVTDAITEEVLSEFFSSTIDSKWFKLNPTPWNEREANFGVVADSPNIWVGAVSWLKAALFEDDKYVPSPIQQVNELIGEDLPVIDDEFIVSISAALASENKSTYRFCNPDDVLAFLEKYKGERCFTVSW